MRPRVFGSAVSAEDCLRDQSLCVITAGVIASQRPRAGLASDPTRSANASAGSPGRCMPFWDSFPNDVARLPCAMSLLAVNSYDRLLNAAMSRLVSRGT